MNDFEGLLATDFGFKTRSKADSISSTNLTPNSTLDFDFGLGGASRSSRVTGSFVNNHDSLFGTTIGKKIHDSDGFDDLLGGSARYSSKIERGEGDASINLESIFHGSSDWNSQAKPVYDDDIFDGLPGLKSSSSAKHEDDDLLGGFGGSESLPKHRRTNTSGNVKNGMDFDDLVPGFGGHIPPSERKNLESRWQSEPSFSETKETSNIMENPFVVLESATPPNVLSSGLFIDPPEDTNECKNSGYVEGGGSSVNEAVYEGFNPFCDIENSVPVFSSESINRAKDSTPSMEDLTGTSARKNPIETATESPERNIPIDNDPKSHHSLFDMPKISADSQKSVGQTFTHVNARCNKANIQVDMSPRIVDNFESYGDLWLTISDIPLFTQPTNAPPPSRPPPPRPARATKSETNSFVSTDLGQNASEFSVFPNATKYAQGPKSVNGVKGSSVVSPIDELNGFAGGRSQKNVDEHANGIRNEEAEMNYAANAMKEAVDKAEAKFRHAKEARERENMKAGRREATQLKNDENPVQDAQEGAFQDNLEQLDHDRLKIEMEREEKDREEHRLEEEREIVRVRERKQARLAAERAIKEARERASAEVRLRAQRAAVEKANAEARERAARAAVQKAQVEARERAAAEAKEITEKAAAESREMENSVAREKELLERTAALKAAAEARRIAERVFVQRATAEARERAAAEAWERAAAAPHVNKERNDSDTGARASSAPRPSANPFDRQDPPVAESSGRSSMKKASLTTNTADDLSFFFGDTPSGGSQEVAGESEKRRRSRLEQQQRTQERAAKALAEKNQRELQTQNEQEERHRIGETLDIEVKRWAAGKVGNLRALLSTLQYVLWPECGWQPVSLTDLITGASVKRVYRKATLCIHPDKVQQKGANIQQKYIAEKVFDLLKEAWNKFNSEELF